MTDRRGGAVCPRCGSAGDVHSIAELATLARARPGEPPPGAPDLAPPGYPAGPTSGPVPGPAGSPAARFLAGAIGRRVQRTYEQRVLPAIAARQEALLHEQIAIAERHPDLRACLADQVIFLIGGARTVPLASVSGMLTLEQSDALVAGLRRG